MGRLTLRHEKKNRVKFGPGWTLNWDRFGPGLPWEMSGPVKWWIFGKGKRSGPGKKLWVRETISGRILRAE